MRESVAIVGGGVAGLSAAHELIERGFAVDIYERRDFFGGKAASYRTRANDKGGLPELPGEHGFRFFPGWYRHLTHTMSRIPYHRRGGGRVSVADNLVDVRTNVLAWFDRPPLPLPLQVPRNVAEAAAVSQFLAEFSTLGLNATEVALFFKKLLALVAMTDDRREEALEGITWWDYLECGRPGRSRAYRDLVRATTRTSVAAKAEEASAYTIGRLVVRTLLDTMSSVDRVLNGPTNEVWIEPWIAYLKSRGVVFHTEMELQAIKFDGASRRVKSVVMERVPITNVRRLRKLNNRLANAGSPKDDDDDDERQRRAKVAEKHNQDLQLLRGELARSPWVQDVLKKREGELLGRLDSAQLTQLETDAGTLVDKGADYFVLALPLEQLAYYVNRTTMLTFLAPELGRIELLARHMDWMAGIQFYLSTPLDIASGHIVGLDSTWGLTAIEQTQFWDDVSLPAGVQAVLSVDIAAWDKRGRIVRKEAYNCTNEEIAEEVWGQLSEMFNKSTYLPVLRRDMLVGGKLVENNSYHMDESMVDLRDRKKQAFYERARGLKFNTVDVVNQAAAEDDVGDGRGIGAKTWSDQSFMWGPPRRRFNAEPLLVNRAGSRKLRPAARTSIPNLFLAGDYVRTETDLACMEGANEAARDAVNGVLEASGSREERCTIWKFSPAQQGVQSLGAVRNAVQTVRSAATAATQLQDRFWKRVAGGLARINAGQTGRLGSD